MTEVDNRALDAARIIRDYCKSHSSDTDDGDFCEGCIFENNNENSFTVCRISDPNHLPEEWEL